MPKKKISEICSMCNKKISLEVSSDLAKDRDVYPFEHIYVHGDPPHAIMLFLDKNLKVRESVVYKDLEVAKKQTMEFKTLVRMSEYDILMSIYNDPIRLKIFSILREEPMREDKLIDELSKCPEFSEDKFNILMLPFEKTGLVKSGWLSGSFFESYFLVNDFVVLRTASDATINSILTDPILKIFYEKYMDALEKMFHDYKTRFMASEKSRVEEILYYFGLLINPKMVEIMKSLEKPKMMNELKGIATKAQLLELLKKGIVVELGTKMKAYYALLCDLKVKKFAPKYLMGCLVDKLKGKDISRETASKHFDLLYESNPKL